MKGGDGVKDKKSEKSYEDEKAQEEKQPFAVPFMTEKEVEETHVPNRAHTDM